MSKNDWLLVPMEVSALAVGLGADEHSWSNLAPDYSRIYFELKPLGPDLVTLFPQGGGKPLEKGIHLHWVLPEAFGHGVENDEGSLEHPHIPNRWLVRRVRCAPGSSDVVDVAGWVVESDCLLEISEDDPGDATRASMPRADRKALFDRMGRVTPLARWTESHPQYRFALTALGSGSPDFAAHYPACRSVLGFHDPDPAGGAAGNWQVSYQVAGWCSDPEHDLLRGVTAESWASRLKELGWSSSGAGPAGRVLCHGAASRVDWNRDWKHASPVPGDPATVCVGNTSAEALAALLARKMQSDEAGATRLEGLLAAFQYDLLGGEEDLDDVPAELHRHRFQTSPGGDRYTIDAKRRPVEAVAAEPSTVAEPPALAPCLPADVESALFDLNEKARAAARLERQLGSLRQALFTAWCNWAQAYLPPRGPHAALRPAVARGRDAVIAGARRALAAQEDHVKAREGLEATLAARLPDLELAHTTEPPFYRAADPVVLMAGKGLSPRGVHDEYVRREHLPCRQASEIVTGVSAVIGSEPVRVSARKLFPLPKLAASPTPDAGPGSGLLDVLLRELLLLDPVDPRQRPPAPPLAGRLAAALAEASSMGTDPTELLADVIELLTSPAAEPGSPDGDAGVPEPPRLSLTSEEEAVPTRRPDRLALSRWTANPWRPLFLVWEVEWHPDPGEGDLATAWKPWPLAADGNEFELPSPSRLPAGDLSTAGDEKKAESRTYSSYTALTPHAAWVLRRRLEGLVERKANEKLSAIISSIDGLEVLSQSLGGFHDALRQLRQGLQLPPINPRYLTDEDSAKLDVAMASSQDDVDLIDTRHMHAPDPGKDFLPLRAGHLEIRRLWVVDSFGQTRKLIDGKRHRAELLSSSGLPGPPKGVGARGLVPLPPRYVQPARLDFRWRSADADHPGGSPLCGWIFPNHLDKSLMICDAAGKLWGALQKILRVNLAGGTGGTRGRGSKAFFWVPVPGTESTPTDLPDPHLRALVRHLLEFGEDAGTDFLKAMAAAQGDTGAAPEHDPRLSILIGRPLALARVSLRIELASPPLRPVQAAVAPAAGESEAAGEATRGYTRVHFPIRLGGAAGAAGGLAGYFVDGDATFYPRHGLTTRDFEGALVHGHELSLDVENAAALTLLLDPAEPVHARCGLLPRHSLHLPEAVVAGVSSIRDVFFQSAPLVGPPGGPRVPTPSDDYGQWSWAVRPRVTHWQEYPEITDPGDRGGFGQVPLELQEGWLKLVMNPVSIAAFWVKEGSVKVDAGARVTLGWRVEGAQTLTLAVQGAKEPLESWAKRPGSSLPEEYRYLVEKSARVSLTATDGHGNRSVKSLQLDVQ